MFLHRMIHLRVKDFHISRLSSVIKLNYSSKGVSENNDSVKIPKNCLPDVHSAPYQPENGVIYDKKPFRITCEKDKKYSWCLCGKSKNQPFCDGTHKNVYLKIKLRPVKFMVDETKEYWLCNCKQTTNRPFCDGTHKEERIQQAVK